MRSGRPKVSEDAVMEVSLSSTELSQIQFSSRFEHSKGFPSDWIGLFHCSEHIEKNIGAISVSYQFFFINWNPMITGDVSNFLMNFFPKLKWIRISWIQFYGAMNQLLRYVVKSTTGIRGFGRANLRKKSFECLIFKREVWYLIDFQFDLLFIYFFQSQYGSVLRRRLFWAHIFLKSRMIEVTSMWSLSMPNDTWKWKRYQPCAREFHLVEISSNGAKFLLFL